MAFLSPAFGAGDFYGNNTFHATGTFTIQSGVSLTGTWVWGTSAVLDFHNATVTLPQFEKALGNPAGDGYILSSTAAGVRSWIPNTGGGGGGIPGGLNGYFQFNNTGAFGGTTFLQLQGGQVLANTSAFVLWDGASEKVTFNISNVPLGTTEIVTVPNSANPVIVGASSLTTNNYVTFIDNLGIVHVGRPIIADLADLGLNVATALAQPVNGANGFVTTNGSANLTNKSVQLRVDNSTAGTSATWSPNCGNFDIFTLSSALSVAVTTINNPTGTATDGQRLRMRFKSDASPHTLNWTGTTWRASTDNPLPTTTTPGKTMYLLFTFNQVDTRWDLLAKLDNF